MRYINGFLIFVACFLLVATSPGIHAHNASPVLDQAIAVEPFADIATPGFSRELQLAQAGDSVASLEADKTIVEKPGDPVTLSWSSGNAYSCTSDNFDSDGATEGGSQERSTDGRFVRELIGSGSVTVNPDKTTTYTLTCDFLSSEEFVTTESFSVTIEVPPPSPTAILSADKEIVEQPGDPVTLSWTSENADSCVSTSENFETGGATASSTTVNPNETTIYSIACTNAAGTPGTDSVTVEVRPPAPPPSPTAILSADKEIVEQPGDPVTLSWTSENADRCTSDDFGTDDATQGSVTVNPDKTTTFTLICTNAAGTPATDAVTVEVRPPAPPPPPPPETQPDPCIAPEVVSRASAIRQFREIGVLRDDGEGEDLVAGDGVYTGTATIGSDEPTRKAYRVSHEYGCGVVVSGETEVTVAPLPDELLGSGSPGAAEQYPIVEDEVTGARFVSGQVLVRFRPEVTADRIAEIVEDEAGKILGFLPILNLAQVGSGAAEDPDGVFGVIASFETYDEVAYAEPNFEVTPAGFPDDPGFSKQDSLKITRALEGWLGAVEKLRPEHKRDIWVIDGGVDDKNPELKNIVATDNGKDCTGTSPPSLRPLEDSEGHGTEVAGVAAAQTGDGQGVAGVALDTRIIPVRLGNWSSDGLCAINFAVQEPDLARVVNFSFVIENNTILAADKESVEKEMQKVSSRGGLLFVAAAGNGIRYGKNDAETYPAAFNDVVNGPEGSEENGLVVVAHSDGNDRPHEDEDLGTRRGDWVDMAAPGVKVPTIEGKSATGSSYAAPLVAGAAALLWSRDPTAPSAEIEAMLKNAALPLRKNLEIGRGRADIGELILNGDIEVDVQRPESPARWPEEDGRCRRVSDTAGGTSFYKARNRDYFLRCTGRGSAATSKLIHIRPGIASLVMAVEIAGMASEEASNVSLEVTLDRRDGSQPRELHSSKPSITASECEGFAIGDASACSPWEEFEIVIDREPSGEAWIVFSAKQPEGNGQVDLLLDHFRITKVK